MVEFAKDIVSLKLFQNIITFMIVLSGVLVGLETYPDIQLEYAAELEISDTFILLIFVVELVLKIISYGKKFWRFFYNPWNTFDFLIVSIAILPIHAEFVTVLRLLRLLRVIRLLHFLPKLQMIVSALLKSIPSMGYVGLLLFLTFYMYGVAGVFIFSKNDPLHFGSLPVTFLTLFKVVTMEGWVEFLDIQMFGCTNYFTEDHLRPFCKSPEAFPIFAPIYFITFILFGTMIILNLFIGVIIQGMEEAQAQRQIEKSMGESEDFDLAMEKELESLKEQMSEMQKNMERINYLAGLSKKKRLQNSQD